ncbi:MAG TPA: isocitrate/isopropylmalate family dehydrogenase [Solirubrobacterales bacterium]|nr:isocitrate/isopropylmalate family dehydrogenase [Solirubrobacterales bacterium]
MATTSTAAIHAPAWVPQIRDPRSQPRPHAPLIGALRGEGIGTEVVGAALEVLRRLEDSGGRPVTVELGGPIGKQAERETGAVLPEDVLRFCEDVLRRGGAILTGPGGGRYVYELRRRLGLFMKVSPIDSNLGLAAASPLRPESLLGVNMLMVRENLGGIYQGSSTAAPAGDGGSLVEHRFSYRESDVRRFLSAAARLAASRRGELVVVVKQAGLPGFADLWRGVAQEVCGEPGVETSFVDIDLMAYRVVERPHTFDVVAASNLFGDILGDLAAVLLGSRALSFGASYDERGAGVYQTNHGGAHDIAGAGRANPAGQILSLAALLRESLGLGREAWALEEGVRIVLREGGTTDDLGGGLGTEEMAGRVGSAAAQALRAAPA